LVVVSGTSPDGLSTGFPKGYGRCSGITAQPAGWRELALALAGQFALSPEKEALLVQVEPTHGVCDACATHAGPLAMWGLLVQHLRTAELCANNKVAVAADADVTTDASSSAKIYCAQDVTFVGADAYPPHQNFVEIEVELGTGSASAVVLGSDLTHEYVAENADYRS
jgi:hypothetical protein